MFVVASPCASFVQPGQESILRNFCREKCLELVKILKIHLRDDRFSPPIYGFRKHFTSTGGLTRPSLVLILVLKAVAI